MSGPLLLALCYGFLIVFLVGFLVRSVRIARLPVHLRWELAPVPKEKTRGRYGGSYLEEYEWWRKPREESPVRELGYMGKEIFFLKALWEHNRGLWWFSFPFHAGLYLLIAAAAVVVVGSALVVSGLAGPWWGTVESALEVVFGLGYGTGALGALGLLAMRVAKRDLRSMSTRVAYFNLVLVLALFLTGVLGVVSEPAYAGSLAGLVAALLTADGGVSVAGPLGVHVLVTLFFLAYLPFSQMMHFVAKYFTYHEVRWDDQPLVPGGKLEREVLELLELPVSWAAPHVAGDGRKNWADVATEEAGK